MLEMVIKYSLRLCYKIMTMTTLLQKFFGSTLLDLNGLGVSTRDIYIMNISCLVISGESMKLTIMGLERIIHYTSTCLCVLFFWRSNE